MNPNDKVKIKPTKYGWDTIAKHIAERNQAMAKAGIELRSSVPEPDEDGYITGQFWVLMDMLEWSAQLGHDVPFIDMQILGES